MEILPEVNLEEYFRDEDIRQKHKRNEDFLRLALTNVRLAKGLDLREGLTYDCKNGTYFGIKLPNKENVFSHLCRYNFKEAK